MSSFLQKLRGKGVVSPQDAHPAQPAAAAQTKAETPSGVSQLPVDVYQSDSEIVIFAQIPGSDVAHLDVSIEGDNDIITIQGATRRPEELMHRTETNDAHSDGQQISVHQGQIPIVDDPHAGFSLEECVWGKFYRQIILPQEVDATRAEAKAKDGVLVLRMPLKGHVSNKIRMHVEKLGA